MKDKKFRKDLLSCMSEKDIYEIRDNCLEGRERSEQDPMAVIEIISNKPWKRSALTNI